MSDFDPKDWSTGLTFEKLCEQLKARVAELEGECDGLLALSTERYSEVIELQAQLDWAKAYGVESDDNHRYIQAEWKRRYEALEEATDGEAWAWVGDGSDDLSSMSEGMVVAIGAGQLRELTRATEPRPMSEAPRVTEFEDGLREIDASFERQCDSVDPRIVARHVKEELRRMLGEFVVVRPMQTAPRVGDIGIVKRGFWDKVSWRKRETVGWVLLPTTTAPGGSEEG